MGKSTRLVAEEKATLPDEQLVTVVISIDGVVLLSYSFGEPVSGSGILFAKGCAHIHPIAGQRNRIGHIDELGSLASTKLEDSSTVEDKIGY